MMSPRASTGAGARHPSRTGSPCSESRRPLQPSPRRPACARIHPASESRGGRSVLPSSGVPRFGRVSLRGRRRVAGGWWRGEPVAGRQCGSPRSNGQLTSTDAGKTQPQRPSFVIHTVAPTCALPWSDAPFSFAPVIGGCRARCHPPIARGRRCADGCPRTCLFPAPLLNDASLRPAPHAVSWERCSLPCSSECRAARRPPTPRSLRTSPQGMASRFMRCGTSRIGSSTWRSPHR